MDDRLNPCVVILAGGQSRRMKFPKLYLAYDGVPVVSSMVDRLRNCGWDKIAIVISDKMFVRFIHDVLQDVSVIINAHPERGMISSLRMGMDWTDSDASGILSFPVDHPLVGEKTICAIRGQASACNIVIPTCKGKRGHPTWWGRCAWETLRSTEADKGAREILPSVDLNVVELETDDRYILENINTQSRAIEHNLTRY